MSDHERPNRTGGAHGDAASERDPTHGDLAAEAAATPPDALATEGVDPTYADLDAWDAPTTIAALIAGQRRAIDAVDRARPALARAAEGIAERIARGGRLGYAGAGTSGRLAMLDAAELPPTFGFDRAFVLLAGGAEAMTASREGAEDDVDEAAAAVAARRVGPDDVLIGIAASGRTPFTIAAVGAARAAGAFTVGIAGVDGSPLLRAAEVAVWLDTGPEVLAGSTRLGAGTAQKAALNALSTTVLVRLGGAYGNLMVGMRATNAKLRRRAVNLVARATGARREAAAAALAAAGGAQRVALGTLSAGGGGGRASAGVVARAGRVREALADLGAARGPAT